MIQRGDGADFAREAVAEALGRNLDRYLAPHPGVSRAIYLTHSASADGREDFIGAEFCAGGQRHFAQFYPKRSLRAWETRKPECVIGEREPEVEEARHCFRERRFGPAMVPFPISARVLNAAP